MDTRKKIKNLTQFIKKNKESIAIILVSKDFMVKLKNEADLVDIETKVLTNDGEEQEVWFLNGSPIVMNSAITEGCIVEDINGEHFFFTNF